MKKGIDMTQGSLLRKIVFFTIPIILTGILQLLFNAMDMVVVGRYSGEVALAAVGCTGPVVNLMLNIFMGFSVGAGIAMSQAVGEGKKGNIIETLNTSVILSVVSGLLIGVIGFFSAPFIIKYMDTPKDVVGGAVLYLRIIFIGMPANMVLNFGTALLRAIGDAKRPLYYITIAGVLNVLLNLFFVIVLHMDVEGVALATIISQIVAAGLTVRNLIIGNEYFKLNLKDIKINRKKLSTIMKIGLPAGIQGSLFSISNILIQSSINSYGTIVVAGNSAANNIEGFVYIAMNAFYQAALSFAGQNMGAKKYSRVTQTMFICIGLVMTTGIILGNAIYAFGDNLLDFYIPGNTEAIAYGLRRMAMVGRFYFLCGIMEVTTGILRGVGYSFSSMIVSVVGVCGIRIVWIYTIYKWINTLECLYSSYIFAWIIVSFVNFIVYFVLSKKNNLIVRNDESQMLSERT